MMNTVYFCVTTLFFSYAFYGSVNAGKDSQVGEFCYSHNDEEGRCVPFQDCSIYLQLLRDRPILKAHLRLVVNLTCTFDLKDPLICCPLAEIQRDADTLNTLKARQRTKTTAIHGNGAEISGHKSTTNFPSYKNHRNFHLMPSLHECSQRTETETPFMARHKSITKRGQFPWIVLLGYLNPLTGVTEFLCGGTIINKRYILTSASCTLKQGGLRPTTIRLAEHDMINNPDCSNSQRQNMLQCSYYKDVKVESIVPHPRYDFSDLGFFQANDIALIRSSHDIIYNDFVRPVCLPFVTDYKLVNYPERLEDAPVSMAAGFGKFSNTEVGFTIMNILPLPIKPNAKCAAFYSQQKDITDDQICAGSLDSCGPDTGGALMIKKSPTDSKIFQVGVTSFGPQFCSHSIPQIYTKVSSFLQFILDTIEP